MSRDFITSVISRAVHDEFFRQVFQTDPEAAADAMEMEYSPDDLRVLQGLQSNLVGLDLDAAREFLQGIAEQPQDVLLSYQREQQ